MKREKSLNLSFLKRLIFFSCQVPSKVMSESCDQNASEIIDIVMILPTQVN